MGVISLSEPNTKNTTKLTPKIKVIPEVNNNNNNNESKNNSNANQVVFDKIIEKFKFTIVAETPVASETPKNAETKSTHLLIFDKIIDNFKLSIKIPEENWFAAKLISYDFKASFQNTYSSDSEEAEKRNTLNGFWIYINFLEFITHYQNNEDLITPKDKTNLLVYLFTDFSTRFLKGNEIHMKSRGFIHDYRVQVIQYYYNIVSCLQKNSETAMAIENYLPDEPAIAKAVHAGDAHALAVFGGQGYPGFKEIREAYSIYGPMILDFLTELSALLKDLASGPEFQHFYEQGLDIMKWLLHPDTLPENAYLDSAPVSFPLIGVAQLLNYLIFFRSFRKSPDWARHLFSGTTGHSQGLVTSVVLSSSGTEKEYFKNSKKAVALLLSIGARSQQVFPNMPLAPEILQEVVENGDENDKPTCMLSINGLSEEYLSQAVNKLNRLIRNPEDKVTISLVNGHRMFVVTGEPKSLQSLKMNLRKIQATPGESQARIPFSKRKPVFTMKFLSATIPAHNKILKKAVELVLEDAEEMNITFPSKHLAIPIYRNDNGIDMKEEGKVEDVIESIVNQICVLPVDWIRATYVSGLTHVLDFGPGGSSGVGSFIQKSSEGTGVQVILASTLKSANANLKCKMYAYTTELKDLPYDVNWAKEYSPKLIRNADGEILMDTRYTRLTGRPPLLVGGMTPTTSSPEFVSAVINAGYNVEVACGGLYSKEVFDQTIQEIAERIPDGEGILCNVIFLNQRLCAFQIPGVIDMRKNRDIRIEGVTIAAGVPSLDYCRENLPRFIDAGIPYVGFKPGNRDAILHCIEIARTFPELTFVIEWTGGRGGGHHSYEDFYTPILETYGALRKQSNIVVVVGSGFGDDTETLPFMTGDWSVELGYPPMPFDGILIGSRVCVAKEARTSDGVKEVIVNTPGIEDQSQWEKSFDQPVGGVITIDSEFGEPIHNVATRGAMFWKEMDQTIFSIKDPKKRLEKLLEKKDYIIERLNKDFNKVWFGKKLAGDGKPCELEEMTYAEVILRLVELLFVQKRKAWIDVSYAKDVFDFVNRTEERFVKDSKKESFLQSVESLMVEDPVALMEEFFDTRAPGARTELLTADDVEFFICITRIKDRKPVPFITVIDEEFQIWLKRDSLWPTEDLEAVIDEDPQRITILQGPVAVRHSKVANQPVKEILDGIVKSHIRSIKTRYYANRAIPEVEYLGGTPIPANVSEVPQNVKVERDGSTMIYTLPENEEQLPETDQWIEFIAGPKYGWFRALLCTPTIARQKSFVRNIYKKIFKPRTSQRIKIYHGVQGEVTRMELYGWCTIKDKPAIEAEMDEKRRITVKFREMGQADMKNGVTMTLLYRYTPEQGSTPIHEVMEDRNLRVSDYYYKTWFGNVPVQGYGNSNTVFTGKRRITEEDVKAYSEATGYIHPSKKLVPTVDFINVSSLHTAFQALFAEDFNVDIHRSVHMTMDYVIVNPVSLKIGQMINTNSIVNAVTIIPSGKVVEFISNVFVDGVEFVKVTSRFLYRGKYSEFDKTFSNHEEPEYVINVTDDTILDVLKTRKYITFTKPEKVKIGAKLLFKLKTKNHYATSTVFSHILTEGKIYSKGTYKLEEVGHLCYDSDKDEVLEDKGRILGNPAMEFIKKYGRVNDRRILFDNNGYNILPKGVSILQRVPDTNLEYSLVSGDLNPIHTNHYFSILADIDAPITQGMWTYVSTRRHVETYAAEQKPERIVAYNVKFINPVSPKDELKTTLRHIGMHNGNKIIKVTVRDLTTNTLAIEGEAEIKQKPTAYVFTGQGAQAVGMGQDLYNKSEVAKAVWDNADEYLMKKYGFSILEIVRTNPKTLTVYFGGEEGERVRQNYMNMTCVVADADGNTTVKPLFPEIDENTYYYEYKSPTGLLNSTQFTQPAINLYEKAAYDDMYEKGYISDEAVFAGHSLGEFSALSCVGKTQSVESLVETTFYRGLVFQYSVERDEQNRSDFAMCAVNPSRVHPLFTFELLAEVVKMINDEHKGLLEIVNYNVENYQYVVTGDLTSLEALKNILTNLRVEAKKFLTLFKENATEAMNVLREKVSTYVKKAEERKAKEGCFKIERGAATIPLAGIDVPFHSRYLSWVVPSFRELLKQSVSVEDINPDCLIGRYIPNLMGEPFSIEKEYAVKIQKRTHSDYLQKIIDEWDQHTEDMAYILLLELLSYQLASAVQWIKTQEFLFNSPENGGADVERVIEFGPSPTLSGMAKRTIGKKYSEVDRALNKKRQLLTYCKNTAEIYYELEDVDDEVFDLSGTFDSESSTSVSAPAPAPVAAPVAAPAPVPAPVSGPAAAVADAPVTATEILRSILAQKLKKSVSEIPMSKSIKELAGGRSTIQNEVTGDLQAEFGGNAMPLKAEELPLEELGKQISGSFNGQLGKYTSQMVNRMLSSKMPAGFSASAAKNYLANSFGLGKGRTDGVLLTGITMEPSSRLGSEADAQSWLDSVVNTYSSISGVAISKGGSGGAGGAAASASMAMSMPMAMPTASGPAAAVADAPVTATEILRSILAQKLKKSVSEVPMSKSIKELAGGRSTIQNEVTGDLQAEFGGNAMPLKAEELPVEELGKQISGSFNGQLGKYTTQMINRMLSSKMPAGFSASAAKNYLANSFGLGKGRTDGVLLVGLTMEPSSRLGSEADAQSWLDSVVNTYSSVSGTSISKGGSGGAGGAAASAPMAMSMPMAMPTASGPAAAVADAPVSPSDIVRVVLAQKLKKSVSEIPMSKSIKELAGGRSTIQNEVTGDLQAEFGGNAMPLKAEELPLNDLGAAINHNGKLGKYTSAVVNRLLSSKMPAGFSASKAKEYLKNAYGLGERRTEGVLLYGTTMEPSSRLSSEGEAQAWLDSAVNLYSSINSLGLSKGGSGGPVAAMAMPSVAMGMTNSAEVSALKMKEDALILKQLETYAKYLGIDLHADQKRLIATIEDTAKIQSKLDLCNDELGEEFTNGIAPKFSYKKARTYESSWNWGYQDLWTFVYDILTGRKKNVDEMITSTTFHTLVNRANDHLVEQAKFINTKVVADQKNDEIKSTLQRFTSTLLEEIEKSSGLPVFKFTGPFNAPHLDIDEKGNLSYVEIHRTGIDNAVDYANEMKEGAMQTIGSITKKMPYLFIRNENACGFDSVDAGMSQIYLDGLKKIAEEGISFSGKHVLITGCGRNSIGEQILKHLLAGGAKVIATTSSFRRSNIEHYRKMYEEIGTKGSKLIVVPFNQGSKQDINDLIDFIYSKDSRTNGLGWDLDIVIPFAAISEFGRDISDIDGKSELAHRIMLTNIIRILGAIRVQKMKRRSVIPAQVILPCSYNHGVFGGDGLYGESKSGLESLLNRWKSESWSKYLSIVGTCIGWTRGTNIMDQNSITSKGIEDQGNCRTFNTSEMAFNIVGLMSDVMASLSRKRPIYADFNGGMQFVSDIMPILKKFRENIEHEALKKKVIVDEDMAHNDVVGVTKKVEKKTVEPRSNISIKFPEIKDDEKMKDMRYLRDLLDLDRVVVVTGYGEVGPYGNSRTRWEMEAEGKFSLEGCVELAWIMGLIKHVSYKQMPDGSLYSGWVDAKSGAPIKDIDVKATYEKEILAHTGIRLAEPEVFRGKDFQKREFIQEVVVEEDFPPFEASKEEAENFKSQNGDLVEVYETDDDRCMVRLLKGASIYVPKALQFNRIVAGQIPTGWDPTRYGIPKDIAEQVDPVTCYCIVAFVEALVSAGITDPYEFYEYVHVSEVGNILGSGHGPAISYNKTYRERYMDKPVSNDVLQESFVNTMGAWINLLLLSSSGPICAPVGACASGVVTVDIGVDYILSGKAKVVITGGFDDTNEVGAYEFAQMKATADTREDIANGRDPNEVCRPCTSSRSGFTEAHGAGVQVLMSASLALKMGVPIYAIIAHSAVASDKEGRSVPAPGQGILTSAREIKNGKTPLLNPKYRARQLNARKRWIKSWVEEELELMNEEVEGMEGESQEVINEYIEERTKFIDEEARRQEKEAFQIWGQDFYKNNPNISPLRGALAAFGLTVDDIGVVSLHGTGTKANDNNETKVFNKQFEHLGRSKGNACPVVCQKYLIGHGKGAASAWMLNGVIQILQSGIIPGNRNADNIDPNFEKYEYLLFNDKTLKTTGVKAGILKAFGFGQVGGEILAINPDCLFAVLDEDELNAYLAKRNIREQKAFRYLHNTLSGSKHFVQFKNEAPYTVEQEQDVYLNPLARASYNKKEDKWDFQQQFSMKNEKKEPSEDSKTMNIILKQMAENSAKNANSNINGVGVDLALISELNIENDVFVQRNFTPYEINYCRSKPDSRSSFAGRWAAKEAVIKAISSHSLEAKKIWEGAGAPLNEIEVVMAESGAPKVVLSDRLNNIVKSVGVNDIKVTISHSGQFAIAVANTN